MEFKLWDLREFCLCRLTDHAQYIQNLKRDGYLPKDIRTYFWQILQYGEILLGQNNKSLIRDLYTSSPITITNQQKEEILEITTTISKYLIGFTKENFNNSKIYDNLTINGKLKDEIGRVIRQAGAHSHTSYISPVTEKLWVQGDITFDEFIEKLPTELQSYEIWNFSNAPKPNIKDE